MDNQLTATLALILMAMMACISNVQGQGRNQNKNLPCKSIKSPLPWQVVDNSDLNDADKNRILTLLNQIRNRVALGQETYREGLPTASNMREMVWDDFLAGTATCCARICANQDCDICNKLQRPGQRKTKCRPKFCATPAAEVPGQMVYMAPSGQDLWATMIHSYYIDELKKFKEEEYTLFEYSSGSYTNFSQMIWADTWKVGCGRAVFRPSTTSSVTIMAMRCLFLPRGNIDYVAMYKVGHTCSEYPPDTCCGNSCQYKDDYPGLCKLKEQDTTPVGMTPAPTVATTRKRVQSSTDPCHTLKSPIPWRVLDDSYLNEEEIDHILLLLNLHRGKVAWGGGKDPEYLPQASNMRRMVWDDFLASRALCCARLCAVHECFLCKKLSTMKYSDMDVPGEITWWSPAPVRDIWTVMFLVNFGEVHYFNTEDVSSYKPGPYSNFTQMVWAESWKVGCGRVVYKTLPSAPPQTAMRCLFLPRGNVVGQPVYEIGEPCKTCQTGTCCGSCKHTVNWGLCNSKAYDLPETGGATAGFTAEPPITTPVPAPTTQDPFSDFKFVMCRPLSSEPTSGTTTRSGTVPIRVPDGSDARLPCEVVIPEGPERPLKFINWFRGDEKIPFYTVDLRNAKTLDDAKHVRKPGDPLMTRAYFEIKGSTPTLIIRKISIYDKGIFKCRIESKRERTVTRLFKLIIIHESATCRLSKTEEVPPPESANATLPSFTDAESIDGMMDAQFAVCRLSIIVEASDSNSTAVYSTGDFKLVKCELWRGGALPSRGWLPMSTSDDLKFVLCSLSTPEESPTSNSTTVSATDDFKFVRCRLLTVEEWPFPEPGGNWRYLMCRLSKPGEWIQSSSSAAKTSVLDVFKLVTCNFARAVDWSNPQWVTPAAAAAARK